MKKYPKINSLWKREGWYFDPRDKKNTPPEKQKNRQTFIEGDYACPEFANVKNWIITEKIDGMNIRIFYKKGCKMSFGGRTDAACLPPELLFYLQDHFTSEFMESVFPEADEVMLFGEGYGKKIQKGSYYSNEQRFCLFDVLIGNTWWMEYSTVMEMAEKLFISYAPPISNPHCSWGLIYSKEQIVDFIKAKNLSIFATISQVQMEGVVARAYPMMLFRDGTPIKFKLKCKDFKEV